MTGNQELTLGGKAKVEKNVKNIEHFHQFRT